MDNNKQKTEDYSCGIIPVCEKNNRFLFLLIHQNAGHWSFPKGSQKDNETDVETAARELREETGIVNCKIIENPYFLEKYQWDKDGVMIDKTVKFFIGYVEQQNINMPATEIQNYKWVDEKDVLDILTYPETKKVFKDALKYLKK